MRQRRYFSLEQLKAAVDADAFYHRDAPLSDQGTGEQFPWQGKTCKDCPFWCNSMCLPHAEYRSSMAHTCELYDPGNHSRAEELIHQRTGKLDNS